MAHPEDYITGKITEDIKNGLFVLDAEKKKIADSETGKYMLEAVGKYEPLLLDIKKVSKIIQESETCAVGERTCRVLQPDSTFTESVFLDELADALVNAGKAKIVSKNEAIETLKKYKTKIIASKVSGKYMEICRTYSKTCIFWNMEKCGLKCIGR